VTFVAPPASVIRPKKKSALYLKDYAEREVKLWIIIDKVFFEVVKITSCYFLRLNRDGVTDELIEVNNDE